jgi:hypothetical protein
VGGNAGEAFKLERCSGILRVNTPDALDYETKQNYTLVVQVWDDGSPLPTHDNGTVLVHILDQNDAPDIEVGDAASASIAEMSEAGSLVLASNVSDAEGHAYGATIASGDDRGYFSASIDARGRLRIKVTENGAGMNPSSAGAGLDFERRTKYDLRIAVLDEGEPAKTSFLLLEISITNENDVPITETASLTVDENSAQNTILQCDSPCVSECASACSGKSDGDDCYCGSFGPRHLEYCTSLTDQEPNRAKGFCDSGQCRVCGVPAFDVDAVTDWRKLTCSISAQTGGLFALDTCSRFKVQTAHIDFESADCRSGADDGTASFFDEPCVYSLAVGVMDNGVGAPTISAVATVRVLDINEPPAFSQSVKTQGISILDILENLAIASEIRSSHTAGVDPERGQLRYELDPAAPGEPQIPFLIYPQSGKIITGTLLDFETTPVYVVVMRVMDQQGLSDTATLNLRIADINEPPVCESVPVSVLEDAPSGRSIRREGAPSEATVDCVDPDTKVEFRPDPSRSPYMFEEFDRDGLSSKSSSVACFNMDGHGVITVKSASCLDHEAIATYILRVTVVDHAQCGGSAFVCEGATTLRINVRDRTNPPSSKGETLRSRQP